MRKILSAALALVCIWFATPSWGANCNLIDESQILNTDGFSINENGYYNGSFYNWANVRFSFDNAFKENTQYTLSFNGYVSSNTAVFSFGYTDGTGGRCDIRATQATDYTCTTEPNKTLSYISTTYGSGANTVYVKNIQLEEGTTATAYKPYNPLCATCDGTIVNYTSATGTGAQNGTPTPTNPIEPTFYKQGNMILRKVGDYADSYDATTGKITRRVGVKVLDGTEPWTMAITGKYYFPMQAIGGKTSGIDNAKIQALSNFFKPIPWDNSDTGGCISIRQESTMAYLRLSNFSYASLAEFRQYLADQYAAGTPVTIYYPLAEETTEDWPASYCETPIKIATTKYNETAFGPLNTALANAISVVDSVVSNTITQAASIATLQAQKQTRPNDIADDNEKCPAGKKCLLVEDASGVPHWYEIVENAWDLPVGYTQLQYIKSTGTQYIDTGIIATNWDWSVEFEMSVPQAGDMFFGAGRGLWGSADWGAQFGLANSSGNANWGAGSGGMNVVISNLGVRTDTFYNYKMTKEGLYINGELKSRNTATESFSNSDLSLWICKTNNPGTSGYNKAGSSWKYVRIYNVDNALVFNGVPAKNPDGKIGMYDKVSGEFFENKGTGDFIAGPVVQ